MGPHYIDYINNGGELKLELVFNEKVTLTDNDFKLDEELGVINIDKLETVMADLIGLLLYQWQMKLLLKIQNIH